MATGDLTLQQAADELGVHYMTAYRYVRLGQLDAHKVGGGWRVSEEALAAFRGRGTGGTTRRRPAPWSERLEARLLAGDATGAWGVVEAAMTSGAEVDEVYVDVLTPAMQSIGRRWEAGEIDVAIEHRASGIATRLVGRLGSRCVRRGRSRGTVVLGAPTGERHGLVVAIIADLLRLEGWEVSDLGADTPGSSIVMAATVADDLAAVGISVTGADHLGECAAVCAALRAADIAVPIIVGGQAIGDHDGALAVGADAFASDAAAMIALLDALPAA